MATNQVPLSSIQPKSSIVTVGLTAANSTQPYVAATVPAKIDRVSGVTLFNVAMLEWGDALLWNAIAQMNDIIDPWINAQEDILIPPVRPTYTPTGVYQPIGIDTDNIP